MGWLCIEVKCMFFCQFHKLYISLSNQTRVTSTGFIICRKLAKLGSKRQKGLRKFLMHCRYPMDIYCPYNVFFRRNQSFPIFLRFALFCFRDPVDPMFSPEKTVFVGSEVCGRNTAKLEAWRYFLHTDPPQGSYLSFKPEKSPPPQNACTHWLIFRTFLLKKVGHHDFDTI